MKSCIFHCICITGLILQLIEVSNKYFRYSTDTKVTISKHRIIHRPYISVCFREYEILNIDFMENMFGSTKIDYIKDSSWSRMRGNITIKELFGHTPGASQVSFISIIIFLLICSSKILNPSGRACSITLPGKEINFDNASKCYDIFTVDKYHYRNMICYKFKILLDKIFDTIDYYDYILKTENFGRIFYLIFDAGALARVRRLMVNVHLDGSVEQADTSTGQTIYITDTLNVLRVSYTTLVSTRLAPPYDTKCYKYSKGKSRIHVIVENIQRESVKVLNRSTYAAHIYEPLNTPLISFLEIDRNSTEQLLYRRIVESNEHTPDACYFKTTMPKVFSMNYKLFGVMIDWPDGFSIAIQSTERMVILDFLIYISTCIGLWYGLSSYHLLTMAFSWNFVKQRNETRVTSIERMQHIERFNRPITQKRRMLGNNSHSMEHRNLTPHRKNERN